MEQQAKSLGSRVQFTGYIPNEDLPDYYRLADLCCVPTLVEEAAGLVAVEAMACGRPVLATRSGGMPEYLQGSQAVLVERGDTVADQLAWSIRMLYEHPASAPRWARQEPARERVLHRALLRRICAHRARYDRNRRYPVSKPTITVIVPVYKAMATLDRCVESIVSQQTEEPIACILVDDGSPDDSGKMCDVWAARDSRVTVIHQEDRGVSGARNAGLAAAGSEYIVFLDSDDALRPGALQAALDAQRRAPHSLVCWQYTTEEADTAPVTSAAESRPQTGLARLWLDCCWLCRGTSSTALNMPSRSV